MSKQKEVTVNDIARRNCYVQKFFKANGINVTLLGDYNHPLIVTEDNVVLSCYVQNFDLIFKDRPKEGMEQFRVKLKMQPKCIEVKLRKWIGEAKHRKAYLFRSSGFYLSKIGNHLNSRFGLFSPCKCFAYYVLSRQKALAVKKEFEEANPDLNIVY